LFRFTALSRPIATINVSCDLRKQFIRLGSSRARHDLFKNSGSGLLYDSVTCQPKKIYGYMGGGVELVNLRTHKSSKRNERGDMISRCNPPVPSLIMYFFLLPAVGPLCPGRQNRLQSTPLFSNNQTVGSIYFIFQRRKKVTHIVNFQNLTMYMFIYNVYCNLNHI
jgi:hypothetical protein